LWRSATRMKLLEQFLLPIIVGSLTGTPTSHSLLVGGSEIVG
jgi:hypothetical protein